MSHRISNLQQIRTLKRQAEKLQKSDKKYREHEAWWKECNRELREQVAFWKDRAERVGNENVRLHYKNRRLKEAAMTKGEKLRESSLAHACAKKTPMFP